MGIGLSGAGAGFTAAGGIFGDFTGGPTSATFRLLGAGAAVIDTQNVFVNDLGAGFVHTG